MFEGVGWYRLLKQSEKRAIIRPLENDPGYILDFSNRTFEEFFEDEFGIDIYDDLYAFNGTSKKKRLEAFLEISEAATAKTVLKRLWDYRVTLPEGYHAKTADAEIAIREKFFAALERLTGGSAKPVVTIAEVHDREPALEEVVSAMERDIRDGAHNAALDRLHTYCQKKTRLLLESRGQTVKKTEPLNSRFARFINCLRNENQKSGMTIEILRNSISTFEKFNGVRNDQSLAHDNDLINAKEARFLFESVLCVLKFLKSVENRSFGG